MWNSNNSVKNNIHFGRRSPKCWSPRLQPIEPIGKSGTAWFDRGYINRSSIHRSWKVKTNKFEVMSKNSIYFMICWFTNILWKRPGQLKLCLYIHWYICNNPSNYMLGLWELTFYLSTVFGERKKFQGVSGCCLTLNGHFFQLYHGENKLH